MSINEIAALPVGDLAGADAHLYLWATDEVYREGQAVMVARAWGFEPCGSSLVWAKRNFGMGYFPRPAHELILVCRRGQLRHALNDVGSVHQWAQVRGKMNGGKQHSRKPEGLQDLVERASPGPYLELFARRQRLGWDTWGDEALNHISIFPPGKGG